LVLWRHRLVNSRAVIICSQAKQQTRPPLQAQLRPSGHEHRKQQLTATPLPLAVQLSTNAFVRIIIFPREEASPRRPGPRPRAGGRFVLGGPMGSNKTKTFHGCSRIGAELLASDAIGEPCLWGILRLRRLEGAEQWKFRRGARDKGAGDSKESCTGLAGRWGVTPSQAGFAGPDYWCLLLSLLNALRLRRDARSQIFYLLGVRGSQIKPALFSVFERSKPCKI
jgi:hypothetical protein